MVFHSILKTGERGYAKDRFEKEQHSIDVVTILVRARPRI